MRPSRGMGIIMPKKVPRTKTYKSGGLYENIHKKRARIAAGSGEKMRKVGAKGAPTRSDFIKSARTAKKVKKFVKGGDVFSEAVRNFKSDISASGGSSGGGGRISASTDIPISKRLTLSPSVSKSGYIERVKTPEGERTFSGSSPTKYGVRATYRFKKGGKIKNGR